MIVAAEFSFNGGSEAVDEQTTDVQFRIARQSERFCARQNARCHVPTSTYPP